MTVNDRVVTENRKGDPAILPGNEENGSLVILQADKRSPNLFVANEFRLLVDKSSAGVVEE